MFKVMLITKDTGRDKGNYVYCKVDPNCMKNIFRELKMEASLDWGNM